MFAPVARRLRRLAVSRQQARQLVAPPFARIGQPAKRLVLRLIFAFVPLQPLARFPLIFATRFPLVYALVRRRLALVVRQAQHFALQ